MRRATVGQRGRVVAEEVGDDRIGRDGEEEADGDASTKAITWFLVSGRQRGADREEGARDQQRAEIAAERSRRYPACPSRLTVMTKGNVSASAMAQNAQAARTCRPPPAVWVIGRVSSSSIVPEPALLGP